MATEDKASNGSEGDNKVTESEPNDLEKQIIRQIEYYFGDINLNRDKFLLEQIKLDDGWIPMDTMLKFQRLAKLTTEPKVIVDALTHSQLMEVSEEGDIIKIRRSPEHPLPEQNEQRRKEIEQRTIYLKGFPLDADMDTIIQFLNQFGPVDNIFMRKYKDKISKSHKFKGSIFLTLPTVEKAKEIIEMDNLKYNEKELIKKWQKVYSEEKKKEYEEEKLKRSKNKKEDLKLKVDEPTLKTGTALHLTGDLKGLTREDIKKQLNIQNVEAAFILFNKGDKEAYVRYNEENAAKKVFEEIGTDIQILDNKVNVRLLEGDEEIEFLKKSLADKESFFQKCSQARMSYKRGGKQNQRNNRNNRNNRKRKGGRFDDDNEESEKKGKTDDTQTKDKNIGEDSEPVKKKNKAEEEVKVKSD